VKILSGGAKQRMIIAKLVLAMPNVMLLDEPTNHLDMESIESLNSALDKYPGNLVFISHDREFVSSLAKRGTGCGMSVAGRKARACPG
jgi:ATPase subunit of ABC transporter with duplicated ATPase domains